MPILSPVGAPNTVQPWSDFSATCDSNVPTKPSRASHVGGGRSLGPLPVTAPTGGSPGSILCQGVSAVLVALLGFAYWDSFILPTEIHVLSLVCLVIMLLAYV